MIVCAACGTSNRDNERFCGNCGAFLEWEGTPVARTTSDAPATAGVDDPPAKATEPAVDSPAHATATASAGAGTSVTGAGTSVTGADAVRETEQPPTAERPSEPIAVQPGLAPHPRRPVRPVDEPRPVQTTAEKTCPSCGSGNDKTRRFCRTCGSRLDVVEVVEAPVPWWRRLLNRLRRREKRLSQRRDRRAARRILMIIATICVLTILAVAGPPLVRRGVNEIRDYTSDHVPLRPDGVTASSEGPHTGAALISDGAVNHYWAPNGPAVGAWVEANYQNPVRILDIVVNTGISSEQDKFLTVGRPAKLEAIATRRNGDTVKTTLNLLDKPGEQKYKFQAADVVRLRLVVQSTYGPKGPPAVAIGEVEFFGRR